MKNILIIYILVNSITSYANEIDLFGCKNKTINVSLYDFGIFYNEKTDNGIDKDIISLLEKKSGCKFSITVKPRARIWEEIKNGTGTDIATSGIETAARDEFAVFGHYLKSKNLILVQNKIEKLNSFDGFLNLKDRRTFVGVVRSFKHGEVIDAFVEQVKKQDRIKEFESSRKLQEAFINQEIHMMFCTDLEFPTLLKNHEIKNLLTHYDFEKKSEPAGIIFSKKIFSADQINHWLKLITHLNKNGEINKILKKYTTPEIFKLIKY